MVLQFVQLMGLHYLQDAGASKLSTFSYALLIYSVNFIDVWLNYLVIQFQVILNERIKRKHYKISSLLYVFFWKVAQKKLMTYDTYFVRYLRTFFRAWKNEDRPATRKFGPATIEMKDRRRWPGGGGAVWMISI